MTGARSLVPTRRERTPRTSALAVALQFVIRLVGLSLPDSAPLCASLKVLRQGVIHELKRISPRANMQHSKGLQSLRQVGADGGPGPRRPGWAAAQRPKDPLGLPSLLRPHLRAHLSHGAKAGASALPQRGGGAVSAGAGPPGDRHVPGQRGGRHAEGPGSPSRLHVHKRRGRRPDPGKRLFPSAPLRHPGLHRRHLRQRMLQFPMQLPAPWTPAPRGKGRAPTYKYVVIGGCLGYHFR